MPSVLSLSLAATHSVATMALARAAADIVQSWQTPGVKVLSVHQLVPELSAEMKQVERVLFIDAGTNADDRPFLTCILEPKKSRRFFGHHETPANLMALVAELEGRAPAARLVSISAVSFDHGEAITEGARNNLTAALGCIRAYLDHPSGAMLP